MMLGSVAASLLLTVVFAAAALGAAVRVVRSRQAERAGAGFCIAMCAALIAMTWWAEPAGVVWLQVALFTGTALWLVVAGPVLAGLHHALMAVAMAWMLTAVPARSSMPGMASATPSPLVSTVSGLVAASCAAASIPWVTRAVRGSRLRPRRSGAASQAAMSAGMAAMLIAML